MSETGSDKLLYAAELAPLIKPLQALTSSITSDVVPSVKVMLDSESGPYPYTKSFEEARNDPIAVLHSSGSTGKLVKRRILRTKLIQNRPAKTYRHHSRIYRGP